jgi:hypothetical protein
MISTAAIKVVRYLPTTILLYDAEEDVVSPANLESILTSPARVSRGDKINPVRDLEKTGNRTDHKEMDHARMQSDLRHNVMPTHLKWTRMIPLNRNSFGKGTIGALYEQSLQMELYGGGQKKQNCELHHPSAHTDTISISSTSIDNTEEWKFHSPLIETRDHQTNYNTFWNPPTQLPKRPSCHPLCISIPPDMLNDITTICNLPPETQIFRSTHKPTILLKVGHIQDLVSYGSETNDAIFTFYLDMLCSSRHATYMSTAFWPHLKQYGWDRVQRYFASSQSGYYARKPDRPLKVGEPNIMIPIFINDNHWVALVRREFDGRVYFYYSDDMNQRSTEAEVKHFIYNHTDQDFCPSDAKWVHCHSTHYITHSNECGPRTILALHTMAFHPHPHANMLLPLMDTNIAQISRTWIAASIISGNPLHDSLTDTFTHNHFQETRHSTTMQSHPYDIIPWRKINRDLLQVPTLPDTTKSSASSHTSNDGLLPGTYQSLNIPPTMVQGSSTTDPRNHDAPKSISIDGNYKNHHSYLQQTKITYFTCHRPFYSGIAPSDIQIDTEAFLPEGYMPPMIDPTRTMRIIMQNPQYSLQLTNENVNTLQLTSNLKELSTAVFVAISPNINWHNPSHRAQFKHPFNEPSNRSIYPPLPVTLGYYLIINTPKP